MMQFFDIIAIIKARLSPKHFWENKRYNFLFESQNLQVLAKYIIIFILTRFKWYHILGTLSPVYTKKFQIAYSEKKKFKHFSNELSKNYSNVCQKKRNESSLISKSVFKYIIY